MPDLKELVNGLTAAAKQTKEAVLADPNCTTKDLYIYAQIFRDGAPELILAGQDKTKVLAALNVAAQGYAAEAIGITFEAWMPSLDHMETNPDTNEVWQPGDMERYVERHGDDGVIAQTLQTLMVDRTGELAWATQPYEIKSGKIKWRTDTAEELFEMAEDAKDTHGGFIPDTLREIMETPPTIDQIPTEFLLQWDETHDGERDVLMWLQQKAAVDMIRENGLCTAVMPVPKPGTPQFEMWRRSEDDSS